MKEVLIKTYQGNVRITAPRNMEQKRLKGIAQEVLRLVHGNPVLTIANVEYYTESSEGFREYLYTESPVGSTYYDLDITDDIDSLDYTERTTPTF